MRSTCISSALIQMMLHLVFAMKSALIPHDPAHLYTKPHLWHAQTRWQKKRHSQTIATDKDAKEQKHNTAKMTYLPSGTLSYKHDPFTKTQKQLFIWRTQPKRHTYKMVLWITNTIHYTKTQNHNFSDAGWKQNLNNWYLGRHTNLVISRHQDGFRIPIKRLGPHLWSPTMWQSPNMSLQDRKDQKSDQWQWPHNPASLISLSLRSWPKYQPPLKLPKFRSLETVISVTDSLAMPLRMTELFPVWGNSC